MTNQLRKIIRVLPRKLGRLKLNTSLTRPVAGCASTMEMEASFIPEIRSTGFFHIFLTTDGTLIRAEEGPKVLHAPPTAHMVQSISSLVTAVDTLGGYNWRHRGDFSISTLNPLKGPLLSKNLRKKIIQFFWALGVV